MNHRDAWELIPWLVNDSLDAQQRAALEQHLDACTDCRTELHVQRELMQAMNARPLVEAMPRASLQDLWKRIDTGELQAGAPPGAVTRTRTALPRWLAAAAAGAVVALGAALALPGPWRGDARGPFRTVSDAPAPLPDGSIRAVFSGELTLAELQSLLQETRLRTVAGPSSSGVYTLAPASPRDAQSALAVLRAHPGVRFAEPAGP